MFVVEAVRRFFTNSSYTGHFVPGSRCLDMELVVCDCAEVLVILSCFRCSALLPYSTDKIMNQIKIN
jgi:hypothetical protein